MYRPRWDETRWDGAQALPTIPVLLHQLQDIVPIYLLALVSIYAGEVVWRDRTAGIAAVVEATLPAPLSVRISAKIASLLGLVAAVLFVTTLVCILFQVNAGLSVEVSPFLLGVVGLGVIQWTPICSLALLFQANAPRRSVGYALMLTYFVIDRALPMAGVEHFLGVGGFINHNARVANGGDDRRRSAQIELRYKALESQPQPEAVAAGIEVSIYPERRTIETDGRLVLRNSTSEPIGQILVHVPADVTLERLTITEGKAVQTDPDLGLYLVSLAKPMAPGAATRVDYRMRLQANGFSANDRRPEIVENGSLIANEVVIPSIGYPRHLELRSPSVRRDAGLAPHRTQPNLRHRPLMPSGSARMTLSATISTAAEQTIVAPGRLVNTWTVHGRRLFWYETEHPIAGHFGFTSAQYQKSIRQIGDTTLEVYYHPSHGRNVDLMLDAMGAALTYGRQHLSEYRAKHLRIAEFVGFKNFATAFPGLLAFAETAGFRFDRDPSDALFAAVAHETTHQWWGAAAHQRRCTGQPLLGGEPRRVLDTHASRKRARFKSGPPVSETQHANVPPRTSAR